jgi:hypothetical protein
MIDSASILSQAAAGISFIDDVRKCPKMSDPTDSSPQTDASYGSHTTCDETPSDNDRTSHQSEVPDDPQSTSINQQPDATDPESEPEPEPEPDVLYELNPRQLQAIDLLLAGQRVHQVADAVGVTPRTITRWKNAQPEFMAEYNRRVAAHSSVTAARLRNMVDRALDQLETVMSSRDTKLKTSVSLRILSTMISRNLAHQHGPTQCADVIADFVKARLRSYNESDKLPLTTSLREPLVYELATYMEREDERERKEQEQQKQQQQRQEQQAATAQATPTTQAVSPASSINNHQSTPSASAQPSARLNNPPSAASPLVRSCPILSAPTAVSDKSAASPNNHATYAQTPSCTDQTSPADSHPSRPTGLA